MKQIVHSAGLIMKVIVQKGPNVENGISPTADSTSLANVEQETVAFSTTAIRMARSLMVVMPTLPPRRRRRRRRSPKRAPSLQPKAPPVQL